MEMAMLALLFVLSSAMASFGGSECITVTPDVPKWLKISDLVFAGTLVRNEHQDRLTFRADRIWKGKPSQPDIVVYVLERPYVGSYFFHEGDRHLLFARVMSPWGARRLGRASRGKRGVGDPPPVRGTTVVAHAGA
jgi:hypothetical protein